MSPSVSIDPDRLRRASRKVASALLAARDANGPWTGHLSSSALSTATATNALAIVQRARPTPAQAKAIESGAAWLTQHQNQDGGWGDTTLSLSNLSTTTLGWAALGAAGCPDDHPAVWASAAWIRSQTGSLKPDTLAPAIIARYGKDRTFSVPILTHCALAGRLGSGAAAWNHVIPLPFELAACPRSWFATLRFPVVSYALPALIAIGQARFIHAPPRNPVTHAIRRVVRQRTLRVLEQIQPSNGGFLEATPLTSFVTMSLAGSGLHAHPVVTKGVRFLLASQRADGSWPIDTNLATWLTTLSLHALGPDHAAPVWPEVRPWLLEQQCRIRHPYTNAAPGGWAWTDLPGGVPDADDTAGALLALRQTQPSDPESLEAASLGVPWLLGLQNRDGGVPTFCRGWGTLPFDRSSPDITAHALRAWLAWQPDLSTRLQSRLERGVARALEFLSRAQHGDGSWIPLWFGNQHDPDETNKTYGTSRVLLALAAVRQVGRLAHDAEMIRRATGWLGQHQNKDGGWGGGPGTPSSVEETALAVEALGAITAGNQGNDQPAIQEALTRGTGWLLDRIESDRWTDPAPIGFYFARLWYYESLYPLIFTTAALRQLTRMEARQGWPPAKAQRRKGL